MRGDIGGSAKKVGLRIKELERIYGIEHGGDRKSNTNNSVLKSQSDLATQMGISVDTLQNYKQLANMIPELSENEVRKDFSKAERIDYARRLERIESLKAEKRKAATQFGGHGNISTTTGTTRDTVASKLGIGSGKQYEKEKFISDNRSTLTPEDFADWDEGRLSTNKA